MKAIVALALAMSVTCASQAADADTPGDAASAAPNVPAVPAKPIGNGDFCLYGGVPKSDAKYAIVSNLKVSKGTYGGVADELPTLVADAKAAGADAIVNYNGAQHFGFWPWSFVRPVVSGSAVRWANPPGPDCAATGGATLAVTLTTRTVPPRN